MFILYVIAFYSCSYSMEQITNSICSAAAVARQAVISADVARESREQNVIPGAQSGIAARDQSVLVREADEYVEALKRKLFDSIVRTDPTANIANFPTISSLLKYKTSDGQTILHRAVAYAKTVDDIALLKEIVKRKSNLLLELDASNRSCLWHCSEPLVLEYMIAAIQEKHGDKSQRDKTTYSSKTFFDQGDCTGQTFLQSLIIKKMHAVGVEKDSLLSMIKMLVKKRVSLKGVEKIPLVHTDIEIVSFCEKVSFLRFFVRHSCTVEQAIKYVKKLDARIDFRDGFIDLLGRLHPADSVLSAVMKATYSTIDHRIKPEYQDMLKDFIRYSDFLSECMIAQNRIFFYLVVVCNDIEMMPLLLESSCYVNFFNTMIVDVQGNSLLYVALMNNKIDIAKMLIQCKHCIDIHKKNKIGVSSFDIIKQHHRELLENCYGMRPDALCCTDMSTKISAEAAYNAIAYMPYENVANYLRANVAENNPELFADIVSELNIFADCASPQKPLITIMVQKYCQSADPRLFVILKKYFSLGVLCKDALTRQPTIGDKGKSENCFTLLSSDDNPFFMAIYHNNHELITLMVDCNQAIINYSNATGQVPLDYAINNYNSCLGSPGLTKLTKMSLSTIRLLLAYGADAYKTDYLNVDFAGLEQDDKCQMIDDAIAPYVHTYCNEAIIRYIEKTYSSHAAKRLLKSIYVHRGDMPWYELRNSLLHALYFMDRLHTIAPGFLTTQPIEQFFACALSLAIQMSHDESIGCFLEQASFQLFFKNDAEFVKHLVRLKKMLLSVLLQSCDDTWSMNPSLHELNTFFIEKIFNNTAPLSRTHVLTCQPLGSLPIGSPLDSSFFEACPLVSAFPEDPFYS
jgi:hypothetical protein